MRAVFSKLSEKTAQTNQFNYLASFFLFITTIEIANNVNIPPNTTSPFIEAIHPENLDSVADSTVDSTVDSGWLGNFSIVKRSNSLYSASKLASHTEQW